MNHIEKVIKDYNKTLNNPSIRFIVKESGIDLLKAVIEEIEERKGVLKEALNNDDFAQRLLISEDDKIIKIIKKSIK